MVYIEQPAIAEFIQIGFTGISLGLQCFAWYVDIMWNTQVNQQTNKPDTGIQKNKDVEAKAYDICPNILKSINPYTYKRILDRGLLGTSGISNLEYWEGENTGTGTVRHAHKEKDQKNQQYFAANIDRSGVGEKAVVALLAFTFILLVVHLSFACYSDNYEYRTKWSATAQGLVFFCAGFAGVLLAISMHDYDQKYQYLADKFQECRFFLICREPVLTKKDILNRFAREFEKEEDKLAIIANDSNAFESAKKLLDKDYACQQFTFKYAAAIICCVIMGLSCFITCNAMDLAIMYEEEDVDEEERARRQVFHIQALHAKRKMHKNAHLTTGAEVEQASASLPSPNLNTIRSRKIAKTKNT